MLLWLWKILNKKFRSQYFKVLILRKNIKDGWREPNRPATAFQRTAQMLSEPRVSKSGTGREQVNILHLIAIDSASSLRTVLKILIIVTILKLIISSSYSSHSSSPAGHLLLYCLDFHMPTGSCKTVPRMWTRSSVKCWRWSINLPSTTLWPCLIRMPHSPKEWFSKRLTQVWKKSDSYTEPGCMTVSVIIFASAIFEAADLKTTVKLH